MRWFHPQYLLPLLLVPIVIVTSLVVPNGSVNALPEGTSSDSNCFYPQADAYVYNQDADTNFGDADLLAISAFGDLDGQRRFSFLRFNLDAIPDGATVLFADLEMYLPNPAAGPFR